MMQLDTPSIFWFMTLEHTTEKKNCWVNNCNSFKNTSKAWTVKCDMMATSPTDLIKCLLIYIIKIMHFSTYPITRNSTVNTPLSRLYGLWISYEPSKHLEKDGYTYISLLRKVDMPVIRYVAASKSPPPNIHVRKHAVQKYFCVA